MEKLRGNRLPGWLVICLLLLPAMTASAQTERYTCPSPEDTLLWQVAGIDHDIYLFGTLHLGKPTFYPLPPRVEEAFRASDYLVLEADIEAVASAETLRSIQQRGILPAGETLDQHISAETLSQLEEVFSGFGLPMAPVMRMQPWLLNVTIGTLLLNQYGYLSEFGAEIYLMGERSEGTELRELESIEAQLGFLASLNDESYLRYTLASLGPDVEREIEELAQAWRCGDKPTLTESLFSDLAEAPLSPQEVEKLQETLYFSRNRDMAEKISEFIQAGDGDYFIAVGAAHLLGEQSINDYLEQLGYELQVVPGH